ncbi:hypothetical protein [Variovorax sp. LT1R16]|uniref:hypothetical protein n=1 Tax=Variovorax sp. LT1R16 TaxID=3443728 RepID=UPI003F451410
MPSSSIDVGEPRQQRLVARKGQQLSGELGTAPDGALGTRGNAEHFFVLRDACQEVEVHVDHMQQVVEVVRDAAGQPPDGLHLLHLDQRRLGAFALADLGHEPVVGTGQLARAGRDARLELGVEPLDLGPRVFELAQVQPCRVLAPSRTHGRIGGARQRLGVNRPLEHERIAQRLQQRQRLARPAAGVARGQHDEGEVGPARLPREPGAQRCFGQLHQRFLRENGRGRAHVEVGDHRIRRRADHRRQIDLLQHPLHDSRIASAWRVDQHPPLHVRTWPPTADLPTRRSHHGRPARR